MIFRIEFTTFRGGTKGPMNIVLRGLSLRPNSVEVKNQRQLFLEIYNKQGEQKEGINIIR